MDGVVLVAYASRKGSTREAAERICEALHAVGVRAHLRPASEVRELAGYGPVVLGGSIYLGRWHHSAHRFLRRHASALRGRPLAVFALGPRTTEPADWEESRQQLDSALARHDLDPVLVEVFGGRVDPERFRFPLSKLPAQDVRDWDAVDAWARSLPAALEARSPALV